jgi:quercetin dioxygenase-like cupin family protein
MEMWLINFCRTPRKQHFFWEKENAIMNMRSIVSAACAAVAITAAMTAVAFADGDDVVTPTFEKAIPNVSGKSLIAVVVDYPSGGTSLPHTHAKSAFIFAYVLAGEIESQVNDGPKRVYRAGESFYETPGSSHPISRNASKTEPAKLLAVFVVDTNDKPLTTPVK